MTDYRMAISRSDELSMCVHCHRGVKVLIDVQTNFGDVWFCTTCADRIGAISKASRSPRRKEREAK